MFIKKLDEINLKPEIPAGQYAYTEKAKELFKNLESNKETMMMESKQKSLKLQPYNIDFSRLEWFYDL